jgi:hypothetical protein
LSPRFLLSESVRRRCGGVHRVLGRVQVVVLLVVTLPTAVVILPAPAVGPR